MVAPSVALIPILMLQMSCDMRHACAEYGELWLRVGRLALVDDRPVAAWDPCDEPRPTTPAEALVDRFQVCRPLQSLQLVEQYCVPRTDVMS